MIISIVNQKGGVAKTTSTITIARGLVLEGKRVLVIDFDPQGNATRGLGLNKNVENTIYELIKKCIKKESLRIQDFILTNYGIDVIPANIKMSKLERELGGLPGKDNFLKKVITNYFTNYDYILIDCAPALGMITDNALAASNKIIIPVSADIYAVEGIVDLLDEIELVKEDVNPNLEICGVVITITDPRKQLHKETYDELKQFFSNKLFNTYIRTLEDIKKAAKEGITILDYKPDSTASEDYRNLVKEIIERS